MMFNKVYIIVIIVIISICCIKYKCTFIIIKIAIIIINTSIEFILIFLY